MPNELTRQPATISLHDDGAGRANCRPDLQRELIAVISKYVKKDPDDIRVSLEKQERYEVLEVRIDLPEKA